MFCPRCGEKNPGYAISCSKCGMNLSEVQKLLEMQVESDPAFAQAVSAINTQNMPLSREKTPEETPVPPGENMLPGGQTAEELKDMGNEYYKQGKFLDAIDCYEKAIALDQFFKEAWYNKSLALKKIDREDQAKVCWGIYKRLVALEEKKE
jgi:tetratricopeptide (TPR) repeat protein